VFIEREAESTVFNFLDIGIIVGSFIFALSTLTSKGGSSVGLGIVGLFWLIRILITKNYQFTTTKLDKFILFFMGAIFLSQLDLEQGFGKQFWEEIETYIISILLYYGVVNTIDSLNMVKKLSYTALFSMVVSVGYGFYQKFELGARRVEGFSFPLSYGCLLAMFLMFGLAYLFWGKINWQQRTGMAVLTGLMGANLLFTNSRGAWLGFMGGIFSLVWLKDKRFIIILLVGLLVLPFLLPPQYITEFKSSFDVKNNRSNLGRLALWKGSWLMFKDHPINGIGYGYFTPTYKEQYRQPNTTNAAHAHNNFLHFLATTGSIGFIAFCSLVLVILKILYEGYQQIEDNKWSLFVVGSLAAMIVFHIQGVTEFNFHDAETLRFFWFLLALNIIVIKQLTGSDVVEN